MKSYNSLRKALPLNLETGVIEMNHGSGGIAMSQLISQIFYRHFDNSILAEGNDFALLDIPASDCVMSTDSFVISPLFFPGGDIGSLAVHGTVNDVAMAGARPLYLSAGFILEEGLPLLQLNKIVKSMAEAARIAKVKIVTGDTKVVERGKGDGVFINTTGIGVRNAKAKVGGNKVKPGNAIIVSGSMGDHGIAIMANREGLNFETDIISDSAPLNGLIEFILEYAPDLRCLRDPTRGGLATTLNEIAQQSAVGMILNEDKIPIKEQVQGACELLGLDALYVANEGKLICICESGVAEDLVTLMKQHEYGKDAAIIGTVVSDNPGIVQMKTSFGGHRLVDWLVGEPLPRIC